MSKYTTGEMAKLCSVSVRTVQYYDTRGILIPSELSEGGRRLYSERDLGRLRIICFLRELGISIDAIGKLFSEEEPERVIDLLLEEQRETLGAEVAELEKKLSTVKALQGELRSIDRFTVESIGDIAHKMQNKQKLRRVYTVMLIVGFLMDAIQISTLMVWIFKGIWLPFVIGMGVTVALGIGISRFYYRSTAYICPHCHSVFHPRFKEAFFAGHTPNLRRLTCPTCHTKSFCIETYREERDAHVKG